IHAFFLLSNLKYYIYIILQTKRKNKRSPVYFYELCIHPPLVEEGVFCYYLDKLDTCLSFCWRDLITEANSEGVCDEKLAWNVDQTGKVGM
ncbi:MAG: hypothetical protein MJ087_00005, partial [Lachnospiraceae bacterium]|nr:hypothetical protein [Lachnospiraceae bacterium]